jgi:hypothetical protein
MEERVDGVTETATVLLGVVRTGEGALLMTEEVVVGCMMLVVLAILLLVLADVVVVVACGNKPGNVSAGKLKAGRLNAGAAKVTLANTRTESSVTLILQRNGWMNAFA